MIAAPTEFRAILERARWGGEPVCPKCGATRIARIATRPTLLTCVACRACQFTALSGTPLHRAHVTDEQILQAWLYTRMGRKPVSPSRLRYIIGSSYITARSLADRLVLISATMPEMAARLTEEVAHLEILRREPRAA